MTARANPTVFVSVGTDKPSYALYDTAKICGNVTVDGRAVYDALVAVQVDLPYSTPYVLRTAQTGQVSNRTWQVNITELYSSDGYGNPVSNFTGGATASVTIKWRNYVNTSVYGVLALYVEYSTGAPYLAYFPLGETPRELPAQAEDMLITSFPIPSTAPYGTTTIHASMYTDTPAMGGYPFCPEKNATFTIVTPYPTPPPETQTPPNFTIRFLLNIAARGSYNVYAVTRYLGSQVSNMLSFGVQPYVGGNPDVNHDGKVDMTDVIILLAAFGSTPGKPTWNQVADVNADGKVDMTDVLIVLSNFGRSF
jgi:hypothetical protein